MTAFLVIIAILTWLTVGHRGFVYWWTHDHDYERGADQIFAMLFATVGPFTWAIGWLVHGDHGGRKDRVIIVPRRSRRPL